MILVPVIQFLVCYILLRWLLKKKTGEPFSGKTAVRFVLLGALSAVVLFVLMFVLPLDRETFFGMNPILSGFLTALITAALIEEILKYLFFRIAIRKNREVVCWLDAIIAAVAVSIGFTLLEDVTYLFDGGATVIRALIPGHLLYQILMGYYYGKARVTKKAVYDVLSLVIPILCHTAFDMFILGMMSIVGDADALTGITEAQLNALPYANYLVPMLICAIVLIAITLIALIVMLRKIAVWSRNGQKQELLNAENAGSKASL